MNEEETKVPSDLLKYQLFEDLVWECNEDSIQKASLLLPSIDLQYAQKLLIFVSNQRIFSCKLLSILFEQTGKPKFPLSQTDLLSQYLLSFGYINKSYFSSKKIIQEYTIDDFNEPIKENTIWKPIYEDDISKFTDFILTTQLDIENETTKIFHKFFHIMDFVIYSGSINILKYLIINKYTIRPTSIGTLFQAGNENIIEFLQGKGYQFDNQLTNAIEYHHNSIAKWLIENYKCERITHVECILWHNTEMFFYFFSSYLQKRNKKSDIITDRIALTFATNQNYLPLVQYLTNHQKTLIHQIQLKNHIIKGNKHTFK